MTAGWGDGGDSGRRGRRRDGDCFGSVAVAREVGDRVVELDLSEGGWFVDCNDETRIVLFTARTHHSAAAALAAASLWCRRRPSRCRRGINVVQWVTTTRSCNWRVSWAMLERRRSASATRHATIGERRRRASTTAAERARQAKETRHSTSSTGGGGRRW